MKPLAEQLADYAQNHQSRTSLIAHYLGIPAILIGILLLLNWFSLSFATSWHITFAWVAVILVLIYYFRLNYKLALLMTLTLVVLNLICTAIAFPRPKAFGVTLFIVLFFGGWALQFIGHATEKTKPSFFKSLCQLLIAPVYLLVEVLQQFNAEKYFDVQLPHKASSPTTKN